MEITAIWCECDNGDNAVVMQRWLGLRHGNGPIVANNAHFETGYQLLYVSSLLCSAREVIGYSADYKFYFVLNGVLNSNFKSYLFTSCIFCVCIYPNWSSRLLGVIFSYVYLLYYILYVSFMTKTIFFFSKPSKIQSEYRQLSRLS